MANNTAYPDQWNGERFSDKEIDQLVRIATEVSCGVNKLDARKMSPVVRGWLVKWNYCESTPDGFMVTPLLRSAYGHDWLPMEALWRIVSPMLDESRHAGYSIRRNRSWNILNLFSADERLYGNRDEDEMYRLLCLLAQYGYIWFQAGGSVWEIAERQDIAA